MKRFSKAELQEEAKTHFQHLKVNKLYATTDGQFFILENRAILHAGKSLTVHKLENDSAEDEKTTPDGEKKPALTIKALAEKVASIEDLTELQTMLHEEVAGQNRSGAVKVIDERISKLTA